MSRESSQFCLCINFSHVCEIQYILHTLSAAWPQCMYILYIPPNLNSLSLSVSCRILRSSFAAINIDLDGSALACLMHDARQRRWQMFAATRTTAAMCQVRRTLHDKRHDAKSPPGHASISFSVLLRRALMQEYSAHYPSGRQRKSTPHYSTSAASKR